MRKLFSFLILAFISSGHSNELYNFAYDPWYTGSLFSFDAENTPKNVFSTQPYLFVTTNYGFYEDNFSYQSIPKEVVVTPLNVFYYGFTSFWDMELTLLTKSSFRQSKSSTRFGDCSLLFGFQILNETKKLPYLRLLIQETFPTGKYDKSDPGKNLTDLSGMGSFFTQIGFATEKIHNWFYNHPFRTRWNFLIGIPSKVKVQGINSYGGTLNTNGIVKQGIQFFLLFSPELSLTKRWVITTDVIYIKQLNGSFSGNQGNEANETKALLSTEQEDTFQLAPAIEYNFSEKFGIIAGVWFSVFGRNSDAFASGVISAIATF
jgi:hypothetical protein